MFNALITLNVWVFDTHIQSPSPTKYEKNNNTGFSLKFYTRFLHWAKNVREKKTFTLVNSLPSQTKELIFTSYSHLIQTTIIAHPSHTHTIVTPSPQTIQVFITLSLLFLLLLLPTLISLHCIRGHFNSIVSQLVEFAGDLGHNVINASLVFHEEWPHHPRVDDVRPIPGHRHEAPHQEQTLAGRNKSEGGCVCVCDQV